MSSSSDGTLLPAVDRDVLSKGYRCSSANERLVLDLAFSSRWNHSGSYRQQWGIGFEHFRLVTTSYTDICSSSSLTGTKSHGCGTYDVSCRCAAGRGWS